MSKLDQAYERVRLFEAKLRDSCAFTAALHAGYPEPEQLSFNEAVSNLCLDLRALLISAKDLEDRTEVLAEELFEP
jgi:hypothetical protein